MIPHGDRRDAAESCRVEDECQAFGPWDDDVMRVFVLRDDLADCPRWLLGAEPIEYSGECAKLGEGKPERSHVAIGNLAMRMDLDLARHA
jgi:hypothetical protein